MLIVVILILLLFGGGPAWYGNRAGWGYGASFGPIGFLLLLLLVLYIFGGLRF